MKKFFKMIKILKNESENKMKIVSDKKKSSVRIKMLQSY